MAPDLAAPLARVRSYPLTGEHSRVHSAHPFDWHESQLGISDAEGLDFFPRSRMRMRGQAMCTTYSSRISTDAPDGAVEGLDVARAGRVGET